MVGLSWGYVRVIYGVWVESGNHRLGKRSYRAREGFIVLFTSLSMRYPGGSWVLLFKKG
jgi:hypothetical protein